MSNVNQVFSSLEPYRVLAALAMPISTQGGSGQFTCDGIRFWFDERKVVALEESPFVAGDIVDFVTHRLGLQDGLGWLQSRFASLLPAHLRVDPETMARQVERRRRHLQLILELRQNLTLRPEAFPDAALWLRQRRLSRPALLKVIYAAKGAELNILRQRLGLAAKDLPEAGTWMVTPYFADWDQVAALRLDPAIGNGEPQWWVLEEHQHAWMGLQATSPLDQHRSVRLEWELVLRQISQSHEEQAVTRHLQARFTDGLLPGRKFDQLVLEVADNDPRTILRLSRLARHCQVRRFNQPPLDWQHHLYQELQCRLTVHGYDHQTRMLVEVMRDDPVLCQFVSDRLQVQHPEWAPQFRHHTRHRTSIIRGGNVLSESGSGYLLGKSGSRQEQLITNFTIKVDRNIWFDGHDEIWHAARVLSGAHEFPVRFSRRSAGKGDELEGIASAAVLRSGLPQAALPVVFDPAHKKHLAALVSHQIGDAPREEGIRQLGWNSAGTKFTSAAWRATALGVEAAPQFRHPGNLLLERHFTGIPVSFSNQLSADDPLELLAVAAALLARSCKGAGVSPQAVRDNPEGRATLAALARAFGQQQAASPKLNRSGLRRPFDPDDCNGLPLWLDLDDELADRLVCPSFYLSAAGRAVPLAADCSGRAAWLLSQLTVSLIQQPTTHSMPAEAGWPRLAFEGLQLLRQRLPLDIWNQVKIEHQAWRALLWRCGLDGLNRHFSLQDGWVRCQRQGLPRPEQKALQEELTGDIRVEGLDLLLPLELFNRLVEENLGVRPTVERLRPPAGQTRLATV